MLDVRFGRPQFDSNLVEYAVKKFGREGITIKTGHHVTKVNPVSRLHFFVAYSNILSGACSNTLLAGRSVAQQGSLEVQEEGEIPFGMLIWSTGLAPNPLVAGVSDLEKDPKSGMSVSFGLQL